MSRKETKFDEGIRVKPNDTAPSKEGEIRAGNTDKKIKTYIEGSERDLVTSDQAQSLENKTIDGTSATGNNTVTADADNISYDNSTSGLAATEVKAAIDELKTGLDGQNEASEISFDDTNPNVTGTNVQDAVDDVANSAAAATTTANDAETAVNNHIADAVDAHDASAISNVPTGNLAATDVQGALDELQTELDGTATDADLTAHINDATDAHAASAITNTPSGNLAATDVQGAVDELQSDIDTRALASDLTTHEGLSAGVHGVTGSVVGTNDTQTLTNKTIDGATITSPAQSDIKKDTQANLETYALTATNGQLCFATDTKQAYQIIDNALAPIGGGSGGLDVFYTETFEGAVKAANFGSGNNASFDGGGTLDGVLSDETVDPISKTTSLKYTMGASSTDDYIISPAITIDEKQQSQLVAANLYFTYDGADDDIKVVAYDSTNSVVLTSDLVLLKSSSKAQRFAAQFTIPSDCTELKYGIQVVTGNSGKELIIDDIEITLNPLATSKMANVTDWSSPEAIIIEGTTTDPTKGTMDTDEVIWHRVGQNMVATYTLYQTSAGTAGSGQYLFSLPNSLVADLSVIKGSTTVSYQQGDHSIGEANITNGGGSIVYAKGYAKMYDNTRFAIRLHNAQTETGGASAAAGDAIGSSIFPLSNTFTVYKINVTVPIQGWTSSDDVALTYNSQNAKNSMVQVYTQNGYGSTNTVIPRFTTIKDNTGNAVTYADSSTEGSSCTINEDGVYAITYSARFTASAYMGISLNSTELTTTIDGIMDVNRLVQAVSNSASTPECVSWSGILKKKDVIRPHTSGITQSGTSHNQFTITKIGVNDLLGVPVPQTVYLKDVKTLGQNGGTSGTDTVQTRNLNTVEGESSIVSLSANQFTLAPGKYEIEATAPRQQSDGHQLFLYNTTDLNYDIEGGFLQNGNSGDDLSSLIGTVTLTSEKTFEIRQYTQSGLASTGLGRSPAGASNPATIAVYTQVKITKIP